jgi:hypothetical protein
MQVITYMMMQDLIIVYNATIYANFSNTIAFH